MLVAALALALPPAMQEAAALRPLAWRVLGPFRASAAPSTAQRLGPERTLGDMAAGMPWEELEASYEGLDAGPLDWQEMAVPGADSSAAARFDVGVIDLRTAMPAAHEVERAAAYLYRPLLVPTATTLTVRCGSDDGLVVWLNGRTLLRDDGRRPFDAAAHLLELELQPGLNHLLVKTVVRAGPWRFRIAEVADGSATPTRVNAAIDAGVGYLLQRQLADGSWADYRPTHPAGMTALACYTLMKCGLAHRHPAVRRGLDFVRTQDPRDTYSVALVLMALAAADDPDDRERMEVLTALLLDGQLGNGMWSYSCSDRRDGGYGGDLSNTQYAALGLRAAAAVHIKVPVAAWRQLARAVAACEAGSGGFGYTQAGAEGAAGPSMTAAGIGTLAACLPYLEDGRAAHDARERIARGIEWLGRNCILHDNAIHPDVWSYYAVYGLERAGALAGVGSFGEHPWYPESAALLLAQQRDNGGWYPGGSLGTPDLLTCFALLVLRRATARPVTTSGGDDGRDNPASFLASNTAEGPLWLRVSLREPASVWLDARSPAFDDLDRVVYWLLPPQGSWQRIEQTEGMRHAARLPFDRPGIWQLRASGFLADGSSVASGILDVAIDAGRGAAGGGSTTLAPGDGSELLARLAQAQRSPPRFSRAEASSERNSSQAAARLMDGRIQHGWACAETDPAPWVEIELRARVLLDRIRLTPMPMGIEDALPRPLPARVRLRFGDGSQQIAALPDDPSAVLDVRLDPPVRSDTLRIEILELHHGTLGAAVVGFSELLLD